MIEARVARLEADVAHIRSDITEMKSVIKDAGKDLSDLKVGHATVVQRIAHLPSKGYVGWLISGGLDVMVATLTIMSRLGWLLATPPKYTAQLIDNCGSLGGFRETRHCRA